MLLETLGYNFTISYILWWSIDAPMYIPRFCAAGILKVWLSTSTQSKKYTSNSHMLTLYHKFY